MSFFTKKLAYSENAKSVVKSIIDNYEKIRSEMYNSHSLSEQLEINRNYFISSLTSIYDHVLNKYPEYRENISLYIYGSSSRKEVPLSSDIDFFVVTKKSVPVEVAEKICSEILTLCNITKIEKIEDHFYIYYIDQKKELSTVVDRNIKKISWNRFTEKEVDQSITNFGDPLPFMEKELLKGSDLLGSQMVVDPQKMRIFFLKNICNLFSKVNQDYDSKKTRIKDIFQRPLNYIDWSNKLGLTAYDIKNYLQQVVFIRQYFSAYVNSGDILTENKFNEFMEKASSSLKNDFHRVFGKEISNYNELIIYLESMKQQIKQLLANISVQWLSGFSDSLITYFAALIYGLKKRLLEDGDSLEITNEVFEQIIFCYTEAVDNKEIEKIIAYEKAINSLDSIERKYRGYAVLLLHAWAKFSGVKRDFKLYLDYLFKISRMQDRDKIKKSMFMYINALKNYDEQKIKKMEAEIDKLVDNIRFYIVLDEINGDFRVVYK